MFSIFRSFRRHLLEQKKLFRYLSYAAGEILLIVIGILIALQINNWNEERLLNQKRDQLVIDLVRDFTVNLDRIDSNSAFVDEQLDGMAMFLKEAGNRAREMSLAELKSKARSFFSGGPYEPLFNAYESGKQSGLINTIGDFELQELLTDFVKWNDRLRVVENFKRDNTFGGYYLVLWEELGNAFLLHDRDETPGDEDFALSEDDYREFIRRKDVLSAFYRRYNIAQREKGMLSEMREINEQILDALNELKEQ